MKTLNGLIALFALSLLLCIAVKPCTAQSARSEQDTARPSYSDVSAIRVDSECRILPSFGTAEEKQQKPRKDPAVCHVETILHSEHDEESLNGNEVQRSRVKVSEQTYVLANITQMPEAFMVEHAVADGWVVDSDPQPTRVEDSIAYFTVYAQPGEIVRLHVGTRQTKPLKAKLVKKN